MHRANAPTMVRSPMKAYERFSPVERFDRLSPAISPQPSESPLQRWSVHQSESPLMHIAEPAMQSVSVAVSYAQLAQMHESLRAEAHRADNAEAVLRQREESLAKLRQEMEDLKEVGRLHAEVASEQARRAEACEALKRRLQEELDHLAPSCVGDCESEPAQESRRSISSSIGRPRTLSHSERESFGGPPPPPAHPHLLHRKCTGSETTISDEVSVSPIWGRGLHVGSAGSDYSGGTGNGCGGGGTRAPSLAPMVNANEAQLISIVQASAEEVMLCQVDLGLEKQKSLQLTEKLQQVQGERDGLATSLTELKVQRASDKDICSKAHALVKEVERLRSELSANRQNAAKLQHALQMNAQETQNLKQERDVLKRTVNEAMQSVHELRESEAEMCAKARSAEHEVRNLRGELSRLQASAEAGRQEVSKARELLAAKSDEAERLSDERRKLSAEFRTYQEFHGTGESQQLKAIANLEFTVEKLSRQVASKQTELGEQQSSTEQMRARVRFLEEQVRNLETQRREMHNAIQDLKGNIRVFCRVRPALELGNNASDKALLLSSVDPSGVYPGSRSEEKACCVTVPGGTNKLGICHGEEHYNFGFDRVFSCEASQAEVFDEIDGLVQSALDGYKVCIFAYGQTGSGKTYTMQGTDDPGCWGLIPRSLSKILHESQSMRSQGWTWSLQASFLEVYNENLRDLLRDVGSSSPSNTHVIQHHDAWGTIVTNLTSVEVDSMEQISALMCRAAKQRAVGATEMNAISSRSHSVFALYLRGSNSSLNVELCGALHLVDLCGSERLDKSGASGDRLKETQSINKSLASLADVFQAKAEGRVHIPFRNSKLTFLMEPCLSGQGKTLMVVNVRPEQTNSHETLCSLRFARQVNQCDTGGKPRRTVKSTSGNDRLRLFSDRDRDRGSGAGGASPRLALSGDPSAGAGRRRSRSGSPGVKPNAAPVLPMRRRSPCRAASSLRV
eukprot:TRINITY_DN6019_c0_g3_i1.p1 TRINITY_DN6019_c0_g3~~TRINITY_DN6019_c0_g3_i1.p1  ORF type:complete len:965 (+),score=185.10 TRINITY_DN6019_c0_g3_i1:33-2927(+)